MNPFAESFESHPMPNRAWRFRISVTALMVVVAVAALIFYGAMLRRRAKEYREAIESNAQTETCIDSVPSGVSIPLKEVRNS